MKDKVLLSSLLQNILLSDTELLVLTKLVEYSQNNTITLSPIFTKQIRAMINIKEQAFNTAISRLGKKGVFRKEGKSLYLLPCYNNLDKITEVLIKLGSSSG